jgi:hypothetical protein
VPAVSFILTRQGSHLNSQVFAGAPRHRYKTSDSDWQLEQAFRLIEFLVTVSRHLLCSMPSEMPSEMVSEMPIEMPNKMPGEFHG